MTRRVVLGIALLIPIASGLGCTTTPQRVEPGHESGNRRQTMSFGTAWRLARRDDTMPEARDWRIKIIPNLGRALLVTASCRAGMAIADIPPVDAVVRLSIQGKATEVFSEGTSSYAKCFSERAQLLDLGSAPWDGYWFEIQMKVMADGTIAIRR